MDRYILTTEQSNDSFMATEHACRVLVYYIGSRPDDIHKQWLRLNIIEHVISYYEFNTPAEHFVDRAFEIGQMWLGAEGLEDHTPSVKEMIARYNASVNKDKGVKKLLLSELKSQGF